jgi:hypothetical protein
MDDLNDRQQELLTLADFARLLRCSKVQVCKIVNVQIKGTSPIPSIALGRRKVVRRQSLLRWMSDNEQGAGMASSLEVDAGRRA